MWKITALPLLLLAGCALSEQWDTEKEYQALVEKGAPAAEKCAAAQKGLKVIEDYAKDRTVDKQQISEWKQRVFNDCPNDWNAK